MTDNLDLIALDAPDVETGNVAPYAGTDTGKGDKRETMPRGGYVFGLSNANLRPTVPPGQ